MVRIDFIESSYTGERFTSGNGAERSYCAVEFEGCVFIECDFTDAVFSKCTFIDCYFSHCNLSNVSLIHSRFNEVVFEDSKLLGVDWTRVHWPSVALDSPIKFYRCLLDYSNFYGLRLAQLVMQQCHGHHMDLRDADLHGADFTASDFSGSQFGGTDLRQSNFSEAINYDINLFDNTFKGAVFSRFEATRLLLGLGIELVD